MTIRTERPSANSTQTTAGRSGAPAAPRRSSPVGPRTASNPLRGGWPDRGLTATAGVVALLALILAALGPGRPASALAGRHGLTAGAPEDVSATLLSGYSAGGRAVTPNAPQVLAASVQLTNPSAAGQRYTVLLTFAAADGRALLRRRLVVDVAAGSFATRQLYTRAERRHEDVTVQLAAARTPLI